MEVRVPQSKANEGIKKTIKRRQNGLETWDSIA